MKARVLFCLVTVLFYFSYPLSSKGLEEYVFVQSLPKNLTDFERPECLAIYKSEFIYVTDYDRNVYKFKIDGTLLRKWKFSRGGNYIIPCDIAVDNSGNVYVTDAINECIQKFTSDGEFVLKWGSEGIGDGQFMRPAGIAIDKNGNVYIADIFNNRIQKFNSDGVFIMKWGTMGNGDGQFYLPVDVVLDNAGYVYVADTSNHRIQKFTSEGVFINKWGEKGNGDGQFEDAEAIAIDDSGYVYVADSHNNCVQKFTSEGVFITKWGAKGKDTGQFDNPLGIVVDGSGDVYIADTFNNRIQKFTIKSQWLIEGYFIKYTSLCDLNVPIPPTTVATFVIENSSIRTCETLELELIQPLALVVKIQNSTDTTRLLTLPFPSDIIINDGNITKTAYAVYWGKSIISKALWITGEGGKINVEVAPHATVEFLYVIPLLNGEALVKFRDIGSFTINMSQYDVNSDGIVNNDDLNTIISHFGEKSSTNIKADVNQDGIVNILDLIIVAQHLGE
jgi:DNA-binding beta-propeller fold protein YncE